MQIAHTQRCVEAADQALGWRLGANHERIGKALRSIVAGPRDDRREQASLLLGLDFKRLLQHRGAGAVGAAIGKDDGLRRARLQYRAASAQRASMIG